MGGRPPPDNCPPGYSAIVAEPETPTPRSCDFCHTYLGNRRATEFRPKACLETSTLKVYRHEVMTLLLFQPVRAPPLCRPPPPNFETAADRVRYYLDHFGFTERPFPAVRRIRISCSGSRAHARAFSVLEITAWFHPRAAHPSSTGEVSGPARRPLIQGPVPPGWIRTRSWRSDARTPSGDRGDPAALGAERARRDASRRGPIYVTLFKTFQDFVC